MNVMLLLIVLATASVAVGTPPLLRMSRQSTWNTERNDFQTEPRRAVVRPGDSITLLGNAGVPLEKCHFYLPGAGRTVLDFSEGPDSRSTNQYEYFGRGLDNGECGIRIRRAADEDDGIVECKVKPEGSSRWEKCVTTLRVTNVPVSDMPVFSIDPSTVTTLARGDDVTITCNADRPITMCHIYLPGPRYLDFDRGQESRSTSEYRYHGTGLRDGHCGVKLSGVDMRLDGYVVCKVGRGPEQLTGAWETDAVQVVTNESSSHTSRTTHRPSQNHVNNPSTDDVYSHYSRTTHRPSPSNEKRPSDDDVYSHSSRTTHRPSLSNDNRPSDDDVYSHTSRTTRRPSLSNENRPSDDDFFSHTSRTTHRPSLSHENRPSDDGYSSHNSRTTHRPSQSQRDKPSDGGSDAEACGRVKLQPAALINRGQSTQQGNHPWHVAMFQNKGNDLSYICGGSLVSRNAVVTAAHCVTKRPSDRKVDPDTLVLYFGKYHRLLWSERGVQNKQIDEITVHPSFNGTTLRGDIAILTLQSPVDYTDTVRHICLWDPKKTGLDEVVGKEGTVVGWGADETGSPTEQLMMTRMPVVDHQTCIWSYQDFFSQFTSNMTLCAGYKNGTSVCNGDSGGGLVFSTKQRDNSSVWHLRALVSLSVPKGSTRMCDPNHYTVFTDVAKYLPWIEQHVHNRRHNRTDIY